MDTQDPINSCFLDHFGAWIPGMVAAHASEADFLSRCKGAVFEVLKLVEQLPRTHWVWKPGYANTHVNTARLDDYLSFRRREEPADEACLWASIARDLAIGRGWGEAQFRLLHGTAAVKPEWVLYAAILFQYREGVYPMGLRRFLEDLGILDEAVPFIQRILALDDPYVDALQMDGLSRQSAAEALLTALQDAAA